MSNSLELEIRRSKVELLNGRCFISLAIPELEIRSSKVELSNGLCSISLLKLLSDL